MNWENRYQTGDMPWEKGAPSPGLVEYLETHPALTGKILVPGCGWGHDVRAISRATTPISTELPASVIPGVNKDYEVIGLDIAPSAIHGAQSFPVVGNERYQLGDLFELPPEFNQGFDWVWEHTCFCAIHPCLRENYVRSVAAALKPNGHLLAIFYLTPAHDDSETPPFGVTPAELESRFRSEFELLRAWTPGITYPGREGREEMRLFRKK